MEFFLIESFFFLSLYPHSGFLLPETRKSTGPDFRFHEGSLLL